MMDVGIFGRFSIRTIIFEYKDISKRDLKI